MPTGLIKRSSRPSGEANGLTNNEIDTNFEISKGFDSYTEMASSSLALENGTKVTANGAEYEANSAASTPTLTNAGGTKLQILNRGERLTPKHFGYDNSGTTSEKTAALKKWANSGMRLVLPKGEYQTDQTLGGLFDLNIEGFGPDSQIIGVAGTYSSGVLECLGAISSLPALASNVTVGQMVLTLASAHGLQKGDEFFIHNPADYSYSAYEPQYKAGEACRVVDVPSTTTVLLEKPLQASYTSGSVNLWLLAPRAPVLENFTVVAPGASHPYVHSVKLDMTSGAQVNAVECRGTGGTGFLVARSTRGKLDSIRSDIFDRDVTPYPYAFAFQGCQDMDLSGWFFSPRHAVTTVAHASLSAVIVNRDIRVHDASLSSTLLYAADSHGNTEGMSYVNCSITGGVTFRGDRGKLVNCTVRNSEYQRADPNSIRAAVNLDELTGPNFDITNCQLTSDAEYEQNTRGMIACITTKGLCANNLRGGTLRIRNIESNNPVTKKHIWIRRQGGTLPIYIDIDDFRMGVATATDNLVKIQALSGSNFKRVRATNIVDPSSNALDITETDALVT